MSASTADARDPVATPPAAPAARRSPRIAALDALVWLAPRLPGTPLVLAAEVAGELRYRRSPELAARVRRNLARVCAWLAENGDASPRVRRAATDPRALEALVRSAFRHHARTYLELILAPSVTPAALDRRLALSRPDVVAQAMVPGRRAILIGMHLGSIELPAILVHHRTGTITTSPMETIEDAELQEWIRRTRATVGLNLVGLREARRALLAALGRGETIGIIADRDLTGGGMPVELFGAPASLPIGPALISIETGAPAFVGAVLRIGRTRYRGDLVTLPTPSEGIRRDRVLAMLHAEARAFERLIALAPDQWWSVFFPIWPDLETLDESPPQAEARA